MSKKSYVVGFPRIGEQRELKFALESFWAQKISLDELNAVASELKKRHWLYQKEAGIAFISINDFSLYDNMLDTAFMLGAIPPRFSHLNGPALYFAMARGEQNTLAMEMTKWFNTNYHYIVPELCASESYSLNATKIIEEYKEAKAVGITPKINLIGPLTFLSLAKRSDGGEPLDLHAKILPLYEALLSELSTLDSEIVIQIEEPIFVKECDSKLLSLIKPTYTTLANSAKNIKLIVTSYFEHANEATKILLHTPIWGIGLDFIYGEQNLDSLALFAQSDKMLIAGVIDGRNIWRVNLQETQSLLEKIALHLPKERLLLGSSCSLLHLPVTLEYEKALPFEIFNTLSFAKEKLQEISLLCDLFFEEPLSQRQTVLLSEIKSATQHQKESKLIHNATVQQRVFALTKFVRDGVYEERIKLQKSLLGYEDLATTTIGSFPQTPELRQTRSAFKNREITQEQYTNAIKEYIDECIAFQEECGLEILVHGEPERNDMVEYFADQLGGFAFSHNGWVQSYGSRCVKPPIIYGDVYRKHPMTVEWSRYAQSKTNKIMKGMLTGPVTILNWSFVRRDIPHSDVSQQIALAIADEVSDLQEAGIKIIQVDEAAFKEGYPLRDKERVHYETWALRDFKLAVSTAWEKTQIHTHMCYSEFGDIIQTIEAMDADVISIETARSGNKLLQVFKSVGYKQEVGPGVYDIHSPRVPTKEEMVKQIHSLLEVLPKEQLWINPDCGLKTRKYPEVKASLKNMVEAVKEVRDSFTNEIKM